MRAFTEPMGHFFVPVDSAQSPVARAIAQVDRRQFLPEAFRDVSNLDNVPVPFENGITVPTAFVTAMMIDLLGVQPSDSVLVIGTGSGYQTAVLAQLAEVVYSVEIRHTRKEVVALMPKNVALYHLDATEHIPTFKFDAILVTAAVPAPLHIWTRNMTLGARLVVPVGRRQGQAVRKYVMEESGLTDKGDFGYGHFVPMIRATGCLLGNSYSDVYDYREIR